MRLFFGFPVPPKLSLSIDDWRSQTLPPINRPVPAQNFHVTLAFIGELPAPKLDDLCQRADTLFAENDWGSFSLELNELGYWPKAGISWIAPKTWPATLSQKAQKFASLGASTGRKQSKRKYHPHLSLFRTKEAPPPALLTPCFSLPCEEVVLYESVSKRQGVSYQEVAAWPLYPPVDSTQTRQLLPDSTDSLAPNRKRRAVLKPMNKE